QHTARARALLFAQPRDRAAQHSFPTRRSSDLTAPAAPARPSSLSRSKRSRPTISSSNSPRKKARKFCASCVSSPNACKRCTVLRSEEHTSELQSLRHLVCRLLLEKKNKGYSSL